MKQHNRLCQNAQCVNFGLEQIMDCISENDFMSINFDKTKHREGEVIDASFEKIPASKMRGYTTNEAPAPFITLHFNYIDTAVRPFDININHIHRIEGVLSNHNETELVVGDELFRCVEDREEVHKKIKRINYIMHRTDESRE